MGEDDGRNQAIDGGQGSGRLIGERYLLVSQLGIGGMGLVWRARDQVLDRDVAVKEIDLTTVRNTEAEKQQMRRALREARTIARISHPHVIEIHDLVDFEGRLWIVMELIEGSSLAQLIKTSGPMKPRDVAVLALQLLGALEAVHAAGTLHRDIKPANVLLRSDGNAVLTDFGIAAVAGEESLTSTGVLIGSVEYMAPERLNGEEIGPPSDLWSLGVTLCAAAGGTTPFTRGEMAARLHAVAFEEPVLPERVGPLRPVLAALLRKAPQERPSVSELAAELRNVVDAVDRAADVVPQPVPRGYERTLRVPQAALPDPDPGRKGGRKRVWWALTAAAALVVAAGVVAGLLLTGTPPFASGSTKISRTVVVDADQPWQEVNLRIRPGDKLMLHYTGGWTTAHNAGPALRASTAARTPRC